jgi:chromosome segregation ATPase
MLKGTTKFVTGLSALFLVCSLPFSVDAAEKGKSHNHKVENVKKHNEKSHSEKAKKEEKCKKEKLEKEKGYLKHLQEISKKLDRVETDILKVSESAQAYFDAHQTPESIPQTEVKDENDDHEKKNQDKDYYKHLLLKLNADTNQLKAVEKQLKTYNKKELKDPAKVVALQTRLTDLKAKALEAAKKIADMKTPPAPVEEPTDPTEPTDPPTDQPA